MLSRCRARTPTRSSSSGIITRIVRIPIIDCVLVPVIHLLLKIHDAGFLRPETGAAALALALAFTGMGDAQLDVDVVRGVLRQRPVAGHAASLQHAAMVPATQADGTETADDIREEVEEVEGAVVGEEALDDLRADAEDEGADDEAQVQREPARGVVDPVEGE